MRERERERERERGGGRAVRNLAWIEDKSRLGKFLKKLFSGLFFAKSVEVELSSC